MAKQKFNFDKDWLIEPDLINYDIWKPYYEGKHKTISSLEGVKVIGEIGVRAGYSARCFLESKPTAKFYGYDFYAGRNLGAGITNDVLLSQAKKNLEKYSSDIRVVNSQECYYLDAEYVDFWHIDADHSYLGAQHDLELALASLTERGHILIDDIGKPDGRTRGTEHEVRRAAEDFIEKYQLHYKHIESLTGEYLIWR